MLLYPKVNHEDSKFGEYHYKIKSSKDDKIFATNNRCKLGFISVLENNCLRRSENTANEIYSKLKEDNLL